MEEEVAALFPQARVLVLSSDLVATVERMREELKEIDEGRVDIVIGTQLVAKGHHFPQLNLVGIVDADLGLRNGDPRAAERTFQLLYQVAGRAGREEGRGYGLLQTHQPNHPVMRALVACDRDAFYASEIAARETRRISAVRSSGEPRHFGGRPADRRRICAPSRRLRAARRRGARARPGRGAARRGARTPSLPSAGQIGTRGFDLSAYLRDWLAHAPKAKGDVKLEIDVDPMSFL